jgi:hypothetical protein
MLRILRQYCGEEVKRVKPEVQTAVSIDARYASRRLIDLRTSARTSKKGTSATAEEAAIWGAKPLRLAATIVWLIPCGSRGALLQLRALGPLLVLDVIPPQTLPVQ